MLKIKTINIDVIDDGIPKNVPNPAIWLPADTTPLKINDITLKVEKNNKSAVPTKLNPPSDVVAFHISAVLAVSSSNLSNWAEKSSSTILGLS